MDKKRILVCRFHHESNDFNPVLTTLDDFYSAGVYFGEEVLKGDRRGATISGLVDSLMRDDVDLKGGVCLNSPSSGGPIDNAVYEFFINKTIDVIKNLGQIDGIALSLHGATTSNKSQDVCGDILDVIRREVGDKVIISASFDLHANITSKILSNADIICGYQDYPHLDLYQTGFRAGSLLMDKLNGKNLKTVCASVPIIAPAHAYTTFNGELLKVKEYALDLVKQGKILDYTLFQAQPWLDVKEFAATAVVVAEDETVAKQVADHLINIEFNIRSFLQGDALYSVDEVITKALNNKSGKPIILVDSADSPNAGACGDSAFTLEKLLPFKDKLTSAVAITDVPAVEKAFNLGVGAISDFSLGATICNKISHPVTVHDAKIIGLYDGKFILHGPQERGQVEDIGKTAILKVGKINIHLASYGRKADLAFYSSFGIDPLNCDLVCVKACTSFRAGYEPIAQEICNTSTIGSAGVVLTDLPYKNRPVPMYPFEEVSLLDVKKARRFR